MQTRAPGAYEFMRKSGALHLPSKVTLRAYTGRSTGEVGVTPLVIKRMNLEAEKLCEMEKKGTIAIDEMTLAQMEKWVRHLQKNIGTVDMGGIVDPSDPTQLASRMLAFVFVGLSTKIRIPVAFFLVDKLTADQLHQLTNAVVTQIENETSFKIVRLVTDNLAVNTKMFISMNMGELHHIVRHPKQEHADDALVPFVYRPLFLSYDYCHIAKNLRSQFLFRKLNIDSNEITPIFVRTVKERQESHIAKAARNLREVVVNPVGIEKQKVCPAMELFRPESTAAIRLYALHKEPGFENVEPTAKFMEMIHKWISIHDISSTNEHWRKRLPDKKPFESIHDERFQWLEKFILKLKKWRQDVLDFTRSIPTKNKIERNNAKLRGLTKETHEAAIFCTNSTIDFVRHMLEDDFFFLLTRKLSSDEIEMLFGMIRQMTGGNFKVDAVSATQAFEKILRTGIAYLSINGNVPLERESQGTYQLIRATRSTRRRAADVLKELTHDHLHVLDELREGPGT